MVPFVESILNIWTIMIPFGIGSKRTHPYSGGDSGHLKAGVVF